MKTHQGSNQSQPRSLCRLPGSAVHSFAAGATMLLTAGLGSPAAAQTDDFNDGNDTTPPPAWVHYNPIGTGSWSFPGGNTYRIATAASPNPGAFGPGRAASLLPVSYTDFYVAVDIVDWDDSLRQVMGLMARTANVGAGTTTGYLFTHDRGNPPTPSSGDMDIVRVDGEQTTSLTTYGSDSIYFEPGASYRLVFIGVGKRLTGMVFKLPDLTVPVLQITTEEGTYTSGFSGLIVADNSYPAYNGTADATFDNYVATTGHPYYADSFNDGNDTSPLPGWSRYNPIGTGSFSFPGGNTYRLQTAPSPDPGLYGPGRVGSILPGYFTSFYVSADIVNWDDSIRQVAGLMARISNVGAGQTSGYLFTHDRGNPASSTQGDMDIVRIDYEYSTSLPTTGSDSIHFEPGKQYRLVFTGNGNDLRGQVFELPNTTIPVLDIATTDFFYAAGACGLIVANNATDTGYDGGGDTTFDNFLMLPGEPRLSIALSGTDVVVTWPGIPFTLESAPMLAPSAWTPVTSGITRNASGYTYTAPVAAGARYYRLVYP
jgi:hypothetical protein